LDSDASNHNVGAVLSQVQDGREVVVAYYSKAWKELLYNQERTPGSSQGDQTL